MKTLSIDIETYSDAQLPKTGVYRYCESDNAVTAAKCSEESTRTIADANPSSGSTLAS